MAVIHISAANLAFISEINKFFARKMTFFLSLTEDRAGATPKGNTTLGF